MPWCSQDAVHFDTARDESRSMVTSFGLAVIDEIHFGNGHVVEGVLGGSGTFFTAGARVVCGGDDAKNVAWRVHAGENFPPNVGAGLLRWQIDFRIQNAKERKSTRGLLVYVDATFGRKLILANQYED